MPEYRADGWPLCPRCGDDELWSREVPVSASDELTCYLCGWRGYVATRELVAYVEAHEFLLRVWLRRFDKPPH
ncbi:MAG TPA: hypothetical protein VGR82_17500 [Methylomirabilota bacterium]|jgi:hypothetical protein|nr:hypothetical protein [Methylomirabilota bacterium]